MKKLVGALSTSRSATSTRSGFASFSYHGSLDRMVKCMSVVDAWWVTVLFVGQQLFVLGSSCCCWIAVVCVEQRF